MNHPFLTQMVLKVGSTLTIEAASDRVSAVLSTASGSSCTLDGRKQGPYSKQLSGIDKATIDNYAVSHRTAAVIRHFKDEFPNLR